MAITLNGSSGITTPAVTASTAIGTASGGTGLSGATPFTSGGVVFASSASALSTGSVLSFDGTNLGIGTNSPLAKLDITSASAGFSNIKLVQTGVRTWAIENTGTSGLFKIIEAGVSDRLVIDASGNVGIGTSLPAANLHISKSGSSSLMLSNRSTSLVTDDAMGVLDFSAGTSNTVNARVSGLVIGTSEAGGSLSFETRADGGSLSEKLRITGAGDVGIGTNLPAAKLEVNQAGASFPGLKLTGSNSPGMQIVEATGVTANFVNDSSAVYVGSATNHPLILNTNNTERLRISSDGTFRVKGAGTAGSTDAFQVAGTAPASAMVLDSAGNVGIGAPSPDAANKVQVQVTPGDPVTGSPATGSFFSVRGGTTTVGHGPALSITNISGVKETAWRLTAVTTSGNNGDLAINGYTGGSTLPEIARFTNAGNLSIANGNLVIGTAGKGIDFSADPSAAGMTSELLDDYEEGIFTPTYTSSSGSFGAITYRFQDGRYTKIGNVVSFTCIIATDAITVSTATGNVNISGLPFTSGAYENAYSLSAANDFASNFPIAANSPPSTAVIRLLYRTAVDGATAILPVTSLTTATLYGNLVQISGTYYA